MQDPNVSGTLTAMTTEHLNFHSVESSNLAGIAFVEGEGLYVKFKRTEDIYIYPEVPVEFFDLLFAEATIVRDGSVGRKFRELIIDNHFGSAKVTS